MAITLKFHDVVRSLERAVEKMGADYVYKSPSPYIEACAYFHNDTPSCIVGHVLADHGVEPFKKGRWNGSKIEALAREGVISADSRTILLLSNVQTLQDNRLPWGRAVSAALEADAG